MRLLITFALLFFNLASFIFSQPQIRQANYYFDAVYGSNSNNGFTPQTAKRNLAGLVALGNNITGKTIAFRDSMYYRGSVDLDQSDVTFTNWWIGGSDKLPRFTPSVAVINWANFSGNVWTASATSASAVWLMYGDSSAWGRQGNSVSDLTNEGDYYISNGTMYLYCLQDPDLFYESVNRSSGSAAITVSGINNTLEYLECFGATSFSVFGTHSSENLLVHYCVIHHAGTFDDLLPGGGAHCIQIRGNNSVVRHNEIFEGTNHGVHIWSDGQTISGVIVEYNHVYNTHHTGIDQNGDSQISGTIIRYNKVGQTKWARERQFPGYPSDGNLSGAIYTANSSVIGTIISYNLIYNIYCKTAVFLNGGSNIQVFNNTVVNPVYYSSGGNGLMYSTSTTNIAKNNIVVNNSTRPCWSGSWSGSSSNNLSYNFGNGNANGGGSTVTNPQFASFSNWDFHLQINSPAINHGIELGFTMDLDGNPIIDLPDAGCYESLDYGSYIIIHEGWNFLSVPKLSSNMTPDYLFPNRVSDVMEYTSSGYRIVSELENGIGYVVKFDQSEYTFIDGASFFSPVPVTAGWNLIGPFEQDVPISQIQTTPPGIINSNFFSFDGTQYEITSVLKPGKAYWIKVTSNGIINFNLGSGDGEIGKDADFFSRAEKDWGKIILTGSDGSSIVLYASKKEVDTKFNQLPPVLPERIFDVRYSTGSIVENLTEGKVIEIREGKYPIKIKAEGLNVFVSDRVSGKLSETEIKDGDEILITNNKINSLEIKGQIQNDQPNTFSLYQNFPNPFNPTTTINFSIPTESHVYLNIYNVLGELITTLVNDELGAGNYGYLYNASRMASGVYYYTITAGDFIETKKMILMK